MKELGFHRLTIRIVNQGHQIFFGAPASQEIISFFQNLSALTLATLVSAPLLFTVNVLSGRILGPHEYGLFQLALSWATPFSILATAGVHLSVLRYLPRPIATNQRRSARQIIASSFVTIVILTSLLALLSFWLENQLIKYLDNSVIFYRLGIILAIVLAFWSLVNAIVLSTKIKLRALLEVILATVVLGSTLLFLWSFKSGLVPLTGFIVGYATITIVGVLANRSLFSLTMCRGQKTKLLLTYGAFASIVVLASFLMNGADKLILGLFNGSSQVGLYSAYLASASFLASAAWQIISSVLAPTMNRFQERIGVVKKINRLIVISLAPIILLNLIVLRLIFQIFGPAYEFHFFQAMLFSASAIILVVSQVYNLILSAEGIQGVKKVASFSMGYAALDVLMLILIVPHFGILGAIITQLFIVSILAVSLAYQSQKIILKTT